jgi:hypothetical protein
MPDQTKALPTSAVPCLDLAPQGSILRAIEREQSHGGTARVWIAIMLRGR